jgi:tetratricopeptide (TPR) repeat protein
VWNEWVRRSYAALAQLRPVRYGKVERGAPAEPPPLASMDERDAAARTPQALNEVGVAWRQLGRFDRARSAYERALAIDPAHATTHLNLGILLDLYQGDAAAALAHYDRFLALTQGGDAAVAKWVADLKNRKAPPALLSRKDG